MPFGTVGGKPISPKALSPGQIWCGVCLTSHEPNFVFNYVILSADNDKDGKYWWSAAEFCYSSHWTWGNFFGAAVRKFAEEEIRQLEYVGCIPDCKSLSDAKRRGMGRGLHKARELLRNNG